MFHRKQTATAPPQKTHATTDSYWIWHGFFSSYKTLKESSPAYKDKKRLAHMRNQIILHYVKNFFLFPIWFFRLLVPSYMK
ncbi:MAG: hypothetical protein CO030_00245, partial [Candidatus Magasanikbacteria bacterium CG_4_9_14_0_2_um_filter_42_11]